MIKAKEFKAWADEIHPILTDINISITNLRIIKVEVDKGLHIISHGFFRYMWSQQRFILYIQLAKLFSHKDNQKKNYIKLFNRIENEPFDNEINLLLEENSKKLTDVFRSRQDVLNEIKVIRDKINLQKANIETIVLVRNKVCAHTDTIDKIPSIRHEDFESLVLLASEIYNTLFGKILDTHFDLARTADWDLRYIIQKLPQRLTSDLGK